MNITNLPEEILIKIFKELNGLELLKVNLCCKRFYDICNQYFYYSKLDKKIKNKMLFNYNDNIPDINILKNYIIYFEEYKYLSNNNKIDLINIYNIYHLDLSNISNNNINYINLPSNLKELKINHKLLKVITNENVYNNLKYLEITDDYSLFIKTNDIITIDNKFKNIEELKIISPFNLINITIDYLVCKLKHIYIHIYNKLTNNTLELLSNTRYLETINFAILTEKKTYLTLVELNNIEDINKYPKYITYY